MVWAVGTSARRTGGWLFGSASQQFPDPLPGYHPINGSLVVSVVVLGKGLHALGHTFHAFPGMIPVLGGTSRGTGMLTPLVVTSRVF